MSFNELALTAKVKAALLEAKDVSAVDIDVKAKDCVIYLKGKVSDRAHDVAIDTAKGVSGVCRVEDQLQIIPGR